MVMANPDQLVERLLRLGVVRDDDLRPCSAVDIRKLEVRHSIVLPRSYKYFLSVMGRGADGFLRDDHWTAYYEDLVDLNDEVRDHLSHLSLPDNWFCFATRMGEIYLFLQADGTKDDPPIYFWSERSDPELEMGYDGFWDWFAEMVNHYDTRSSR
jgi:hypothetical protein